MRGHEPQANLRSTTYANTTFNRFLNGRPALRGQWNTRNLMPATPERGAYHMRTLPIHLDRLDAALRRKGVTLKRHSLIDVAADVFGYHAQNQLTAAARAGDLEPPKARGIGIVSVQGHDMVLLEDAEGRPFAVAADPVEAPGKSGAFMVSPYGGLVDMRDVGIPPDMRTGSKNVLHFAAITHEYGSNLYSDPTEEGLKRQIADWCREYWDREGIDGSYEGLSDEETCDAYFEQAEDDGVTYYDPDDVKIPAFGTAPVRNTPYVPDNFDMRSAYLIGRATDDADEPFLYWSSKDGWVDSRAATVLDEPHPTWPIAGIEPGSLFVLPLPEGKPPVTHRPYLNHDGKDLDIVFLTNRDCDVQGPPDRAAEALPWLEAADIDVGMGPIRTAEIGYAALVDGEVYLAPTIKAFHFDADEPIRAMRENSEELQEYAAAIEPAIRAVGGMVMLEEETEAVVLTILIPLREARRATDLECWKAALEDLITPGGSGERIVARFHPQTVIGDGCYDADVLGDDRIDATYELKLMGEEAVTAMQDSDDEAEALKEAVRAPEWVREWYGPFSVDVRNAAAGYYCFDPDDAE